MHHTRIAMEMTMNKDKWEEFEPIDLVGASPLELLVGASKSTPISITEDPLD